MYADGFEKRLKRVNYKFRLLPAPNPRFRYVCFELPSGEFEIICSCEGGLMPEFSVGRLKEEIIPHPWERNLKGYSHEGEPVRAKELEQIANEVNPTNTAADGGEAEALARIQQLVNERIPDKEHQPGWIKLQRMWGEEIRGWRTVLARIALAERATPFELEREFGPAHRADWAQVTGKV